MLRLLLGSSALLLLAACARPATQLRSDAEVRPPARLPAPLRDRGKSSSAATTTLPAEPERISATPQADTAPAVDAVSSAHEQALEAEGYIDPARCELANLEAVRVLAEPGGAKQFFSVHDYAARTLRIERVLPEGRQQHCLSVAWPQGLQNSAGQPVQVAAKLDKAWLGLVHNTLARVPWHHVLLVRRIVIDNRPKEHGIAAFNRDSPSDARDGRTLWLHEHLFTAPNHWARGNYGAYFSYHLNQDGTALGDAPPDHDLFSPILLHELGHLVMYWIENKHLRGPAAASNVACAVTCKDTGNCSTLSKREQEQGCISPYCAPFRFEASTENWAEQYRLYYQSSLSRSLLAQAQSACLSVLEKQQGTMPDPWRRGLPDMASYRRSRWDSCGQRECKPW